MYRYPQNIRQKVNIIIPENEWNNCVQKYNYENIRKMFIVNLGGPFDKTCNLIIEQLKRLKIPYTFGVQFPSKTNVHFVPLDMTFNINNIDELERFYVTVDEVFFDRIPLSILIEYKDCIFNFHDEI